ncbi:MAG: hypothetical protein EPN93_00225 [Spirochaetes bacterium]|nr:MAG: hypothetical protein EPN93_00225 [Spirochaetota bacterium]
MENKKVFIGNLDFAVTGTEVKDLLSQYGAVTAIKMRKKKGYAIVEMEEAAQAEEAVAKLTGTMYKEREIRISMALKPEKAKSLSVKKYRERGEVFAKEKAEGEPGADTPDGEIPFEREDKPFKRKRTERTGPPRGKPKADFRPKKRTAPFRERSAPVYKGAKPAPTEKDLERWETEQPVDSSRSPGKVWSGEKPVYISKPAPEDGRKPYRASPGRTRGAGSGERSYGSGTGRKKTGNEKGYGSPRPQKREWTREKPAYSDKPAREGGRSERGGSSRPERGPSERSYGQKERPFGNYSREKSGTPRPPRKEWSPGKSSGSSRPAGGGWNEKPRRSASPGDGPRAHSKPRPGGGSKDRFARPSGPKTGDRGRKSPGGSSRPGPRTGAGGRRPKGD